MRLSGRNLIVLALIWLLWPGFSGAAYRVAVGESDPNVLDLEDGRLVGAVGQLYQCVFDQTGREFLFEAMPLKRALFHLERGEVAVTVPLAKLDARDRFADFGGRLLEAHYVFVSLRPLPPVHQTSGLRFVLQRSFVGNAFVDASPDEVTEVNTLEQVFGMLSFGRGDVTVMLKAAVDEAPVAQPLHVQPAGTIPASLYVSQKYSKTGLLADLRESVKHCRQKYQDLIRQF